MRAQLKDSNKVPAGRRLGIAELDEPKVITKQEPEPVKAEPIQSKPKKPEWKIDKEIKKEVEDTATQNIEEFESQDIDFNDDFSNDATEVKVEEKVEEVTPSISNTISDVADEFLKEDFDILLSKKAKVELNPLNSNWSGENNQVTTAVQTDSHIPLQTNKDVEILLARCMGGQICEARGGVFVWQSVCQAKQQQRRLYLLLLRLKTLLLKKNYNNSLT